MNDDLSARARARAHHHFLNTTTHDLFIECAARIEQMEAALRNIANNHLYQEQYKSIASAALDQTLP